MPFLVRLSNRALRDLEAIYEFIEAGASDKTIAWVNELSEIIYSLE